MPVLPEVGSTITDSPGRMRPSCSAASIIASAMRSLTEPPGLNCSHLTHTSAAFGPASCSGRRRSRTSGVPPMSSRMFSTCTEDCGKGYLLDEVHVRLRVAAVDAERLAALAEVANGHRVEHARHLRRQFAPDVGGHLLRRARAGRRLVLVGEEL